MSLTHLPMHFSDFVNLLFGFVSSAEGFLGRWMEAVTAASVDALEAVDEFLGEGFAGFGPEEAAADAAVFFDREGEG